MGCNILNMLYHLNLSLLEVFFVYTIKMSRKERFSLFAHIPSPQLVTKLPNSNKSGAKGNVLISGPWLVCMRGRTENFTHDARYRSQVGYVLALFVRPL